MVIRGIRASRFSFAKHKNMKYSLCKFLPTFWRRSKNFCGFSLCICEFVCVPAGAAGGPDRVCSSASLVCFVLLLRKRGQSGLPDHLGNSFGKESGRQF